MSAIDTEESKRSRASRLDIIQSYEDYGQSPDLKGCVSKLLSTVPDKYLLGLGSVVLCRQSDQPRRERLGSIKSRGRKLKRRRVAGLYHYAWKGQAAWIQIYVDKLAFASRWSRWIPLYLEVTVGQVLYHELGHHAHTLHREFGEKEDVADEWKKRFMANHLRKAYWYCLPLLKMVSFLANKYLKYLGRKARLRDEKGN